MRARGLLNADLAIAIAACAAAAAALVAAYRTAAASEFSFIDFECFYAAARRLRAGGPLYIPVTATRPYVYLPPLALALEPLACLPFAVAARVWLALNLALLTASLGALCAALGMGRRAWAGAAVCVAVALQVRAVEFNLGLGQANFLLLPVLVGIGWAHCTRRPRALVALVVIGFLIKTWMLAWVVFLMLKRRWAAAGATLAICAAAAAGSFAIVGWREFGPFMVITSTFGTNLSDFWMVSQSLPAFARTHFAGTPIVAPVVVSAPAMAAVLAAGAAAGVWALYVIAADRDAREPYPAFLEAGAFLLTLILAMPYCDPGYFTNALPLLSTLAVGAALPGRTRIRLAGAAAAIVLTAGMMVHFPIGGPALRGWQEGWRSLATTGFFGVMAAAWAAAMAVLRRETA